MAVTSSLVKFGANQCKLAIPCICSLFHLHMRRLDFSIELFSRYQWSRGLRHRSTAARMLRSWVWIPPGAWMFVCCVLSGRGLCNELITRPEGRKWWHIHTTSTWTCVCLPVVWEGKMGQLENECAGVCQQTCMFGFVCERAKQFIAWSQWIFVCGKCGENMQRLLKGGSVNVL
jgi:hypothetical protein